MWSFPVFCLGVCNVFGKCMGFCHVHRLGSCDVSWFSSLASLEMPAVLGSKLSVTVMVPVLETHS